MRVNNIAEKEELLKEIKYYNSKIHVTYAKICKDLEIDYSNLITSFREPKRISLINLKRVLELEKKIYEEELASLDRMVRSMFIVLKSMQKQQKSEHDIKMYVRFIQRSVKGNEKALSADTLEELKKEGII